MYHENIARTHIFHYMPGVWSILLHHQRIEVNANRIKHITTYKDITFFACSLEVEPNVSEYQMWDISSLIRHSHGTYSLYSLLICYFMVFNHSENMNQIGNLPQVGVDVENNMQPPLIMHCTIIPYHLLINPPNNQR